MIEQEFTQLSFVDKLTSSGLECSIDNSSCRLDIKVKLYYGDMDKLSKIQKQFTMGIVGVFWNEHGTNHKVQYLPHRIDNFDGYEVRGGWIDVDLNNVVDVIFNDIDKLCSHFVKFNKH